ncbi:hypothetical protein CEXT_589401 [Caerostris extrusa]|uniref:Uncharacterized protein n=1 Tax=Caerostris extrusa TaxID=172846 RepID=A0AAV4QL17_CAEEX|nr:hypothetical protein CEXT_589401 [Caerostris extrusa]
MNRPHFRSVGEGPVKAFGPTQELLSLAPGPQFAVVQQTHAEKIQGLRRDFDEDGWTIKSEGDESSVMQKRTR